MAQRNQPAAPTRIPAGAALDDFVFPSKMLFLISGRYGGWRAQPVFERITPDRTFQLSVGLRVPDSTEANFVFDVR